LLPQGIDRTFLLEEVFAVSWTEDFHELIQQIAGQPEFAETSFDVSDYPILAEAYVLRHGKLGALRSQMNERWHSPTSMSPNQIFIFSLLTLIVDRFSIFSNPKMQRLLISGAAKSSSFVRAPITIEKSRSVR
jgi:hypothetical protein